ncbi:response regulator containing a CheY-like receiver domain and an HTH DNA-binding domain [Chthonomonas calidirosea]|uniref:response regulator n=1 Tax=Chthonomonas calidirosea TaxID=454171 RepID=UPI0006DD472E|nr:response regulator [Chthonomonas calidirosea]CEK14201.1 response regulator containing a CheY-like receiver domain and an HTH DNA-binding domain [Chthonomonas calidirosea]
MMDVGSDNQANTYGYSGLSAVSGVPLEPDELHKIVRHTVEDAAKMLECSHMAALSHVPAEGRVCGVLTVGYTDENFRLWGVSLEEAGAIATVVRTGEYQLIEDSELLPYPLSERFCERILIVPLSFEKHVLSVLVGQVDPRADVESPEWHERVRAVAQRVGLFVELQRLANAYQEEVQRRQYLRDVIAAILEERSLQDIGQMLLEMVASRFRAEIVGLFLKDGEEIKPIALRNISAEFGRDIARIASKSIRPRAFASTMPIYRTVNDRSVLTKEMRERLAREGIRAVWMAMLQLHDQIGGALVIYLKDERVFAPADVAAFQGLADIATLGIAMSRLLEDQRRYATIQERTRLGREMHDTVARSLGALVLTLETAQSFLRQENTIETEKLLNAALELTREALNDTRRAIEALSPPELETMTPAQVIAQELQALERAGIATQFVISGNEIPLSKEQSLALLRIAQEALNNALRHSQASRVRVGLLYESEAIIMRIEDDGVGFDPTLPMAPNRQGGYGIFGMKERARALGGEVAIESTPGWGTQISVRLPYEMPSGLPPSQVLPERASNISAEALPPKQDIAGEALPLEKPLQQLRLLIVDDHPLTRQGMRAVLEQTGPFLVVGEAGDVDEAIIKAQQLRPDVVLLDLQMPGGGGIAALKQLASLEPRPTAILIASIPTEDSVTAALRLGARGFLLKDATPSELVSSIEAAHRGEIVLSPGVSAWLTELNAHRRDSREDVELNERELEVLRLVAKGARNKDIAQELFIAPKTVEHHLSNIFAKLGAANRTEAVRLAIEKGLI